MGSFVTGYFSTPFWCQIFYCREIPHSITSFLDEDLLVSNFLALTNNATVNNLTQDFVWMHVFNFPGYATREKIAVSYNSFMFNLEGLPAFLPSDVAFYLSTSKVGEF